MAKPALKWAGGKTSILDQIEKRIDKIDTTNATLYDLFTGGGSVAIKLSNRFKKTVINDKNKELKYVYESIKSKPTKLIKFLEMHKNNHSHDYYYEIRMQDRLDLYAEMPEIEKAARTLYLNKTCFNGLYRVNSKGQFNVPIGRQSKVSIYDKENILELSDLLNKIEIRNSDYSTVIEECVKGDVVYIDPPYDKINSSSFTGYNASKFDEFDQERLVKDIDRLTKKGVYVIASNAYTDKTKKLYSKYFKKGDIFDVRRSIGSKTIYRSKASELLIDNIEVIRRVN